MNKEDICSAIDALLSDVVDINERVTIADSYYACEPRGDEQEGYSSFTSSQVADVVDSDMPTLARVFLGAGGVVEFVPLAEQDAHEAMAKTEFVDAEIKSIPDYYRTMHGALMAASLHPVTVVRYGYDERKTTRLKRHDDVTLEQIAALDAKYRAQWAEVEFIEYSQYEDSDTYDVTFKLTRNEDLTPFARRVRPDEFVINKDATSKADARIIGERVLTRRGDLVQSGYSKAKIDKISGASGIERGLSQGQDWASEQVEGFDGFIRFDANGDGIAELLRVVKFGDELLEIEEVEDDARAIEFAIGSATLLPDNIIGMSRAERVIPYQDAMTTISRAMLDNTAQITRGRLIVNTSTDVGLNVHDVLGDGSIIRAAPMAGTPISEAITALQIQPVAQEALTVIQFLDSQRAQSTGGLLANQGLKADVLHKETATRFKGIDDSAQAKIELMIRTLAETLFRDLYEGFAYYAQYYGIKERHGHNPAQWQYDQPTRVAVGTGFGDTEKTLETFSGFLSLAPQLAGTGIIDAKTTYNTIARMAKAAGIHNVSDYFNDPEQPAQMIRAENEQLKARLAQIQQQLEASATLLQAEQIRAQAKLDGQAMQNQLDMMKLELERYKAISANALKLTEMEQAAGKQLNSEVKNNTNA